MPDRVEAAEPELYVPPAMFEWPSFAAPMDGVRSPAERIQSRLADLAKVRTLLLPVLVLLAAPPAAAVDETTFHCEDRVGVAAGVRWGRRRAECILHCQARAYAGDPRSCSTPPGFDDETRACVDRADERLFAEAVRFCPPQMPACYGGIDPFSFALALSRQRAPLIDQFTAPLFLCDPDRFGCEALVVVELNKLARSLTRCLAGCARALQLDGDDTRQCMTNTGADPFNSLDPITGRCARAAILRAERAIRRRCRPLPQCGVYLGGLSAAVNIITSNVAGPYANPRTFPYCAP